MFGVGQRRQDSSLIFQTASLEGVILFLLFVRTVDCAVGESSWRVRVKDSTAYVYNTQEFYEALTLVEHGDGSCSTISLQKSFAIRGAVWSPKIVLSRNVTIVGAHQDIQISITKSTTIAEIHNATILVQGFRFWPLKDGESQKFKGSWESRPAWFELGENAAAHFQDVVWDMGSTFRLTNRPVHIDPSHPEFVSRVKETDEAVVFVRVVMPPCTFTNASFQHKASTVLSAAGTLPETTAKVGNPDDLHKVLKRGHEGGHSHVNIEIVRDMGFNGSHSQMSSIQVLNSICVTRSEEAVLWLAPDSKPGFLNIAPPGHVHFEKIALVLSRGDKGMEHIQDNIQSWFPLVKFPNAEVGPRCLVSVRSSTIRFECELIKKLKKRFPDGYLADIDDGNHDHILVSRFIGSGVCMEQVIVTCRMGNHNEYFENRNIDYVSSPGIVPSKKKKISKTKGDRALLFAMVVFGALVLVSVLALLAHWGSFGFPKYLNRKMRNMSRKTTSKPEPSENGCFVVVSVSSDGSNLTKESRDISAVRDLGAPTLEDNTNQAVLRHGLVSPSMWTSGVGLATLDDEEVVEIEHLVGHGGFGVVYKGKWKGQPVAVKSLVFEQSSTTFGTECPKKQRAILEAGIGSIVDHPNIVQTYTYTIESPGEIEAVSDNHPFQSKMYMVQEFCEMGSLRMAMENHLFVCAMSKRPNLRSILKTAQDIAEGMAYLHERNIIHGDLTAKNILLRASDDSQHKMIAKICDFGLSVKLRPADSQLANCKAGTPLYMAPEVGQHGILSKKADVYSYGIVLWEMFRRSLHSAKWGTCKVVMEFPIECPLRLALLICWCLAPRPADRPDFDIILDIVNGMASRAGTPEYDLKRGAKRINRKLAAKMPVLTPNRVQELLMGVTMPLKPLFDKDVALPSSDEHAYCLTMKTVKIDNSEALSLAWRVYTSSLCSVPLGPIIVSKPLSSSMEENDVLSQGRSSEQSCKEKALDVENQVPSKAIHEQSLSMKTSESEAMVAWVHWLSDMDTQSNRVIEMKSTSAGIKSENHSSGQPHPPWRSVSLPPAIDKMFLSSRK